MTPSARRNLTFVIVGGGPTGVELAGMLPTIARFALPRISGTSTPRRRASSSSRAGRAMLPTFPEELSARARDAISRSSASRCAPACVVTNVGDGFVETDGERIEARTIFWAAGNAASPLGAVARRDARSHGARRS